MASAAEGGDEGGDFERLVDQGEVGGLGGRVSEAGVGELEAMAPGSGPRAPPIESPVRRGGHCSP